MSEIIKLPIPSAKLAATSATFNKHTQVNHTFKQALSVVCECTRKG